MSVYDTRRISLWGRPCFREKIEFRHVRVRDTSYPYIGLRQSWSNCRSYLPLPSNGTTTCDTGRRHTYLHISREYFRNFFRQIFFKTERDYTTRPFWTLHHSVLASGFLHIVHGS